MMNVLFLTKYDRLAANTRYRCLQFIPLLEHRGIHCEVSPLLDDEYLRFKFKKGHYPVIPVFRAYWRRLKVLMGIRRFDVVVLHYELFPYFPAFFERLLALLGVHYVYDFDDAIHHQYDVHSNPLVRFFLRNKIQRVIKGASAVLAGNSYLADYANQVCPNISIVPTVVDPDRYAKARVEHSQADNRVFTIGWVGSPSTVIYVRQKAQALRRFCLKYNAKLVLVGSGPIELPGVPLEVREWSEETELDELKNFDVGIMPLTDDPWSRGKCGFKLIQYMACSLPVVASPVGVNRDLVLHGESGYLATSDEEWIEALESLYESKERRAAMGEKGLQKVLEDYSLGRFAPKVANVLWESLPPERHASLISNVDKKVANNFGDEWAAFPQSSLPSQELKKLFDEYFGIFPFEKLDRETAVGVDVGCGSGRWALFVAPLVKKLVCLDASDKALFVAQQNLHRFSNVEYVHANVGRLPFETASLDFAYSIGVLHHVPDPSKGLREIARTLKKGAPFLVYIYYAFDNRGEGYKLIWGVSDLLRLVISRLPFRLKYWVSQLIALTVYWPLARMASVLDFFGVLPSSWPLSYYREKAFYVMRTDALDRFGTRLEKRFTREEVRAMLEAEGFKEIVFSNKAPYWVATCTRG